MPDLARGRPKYPDGVARTRVVQVRLTVKEHDRVKAAALGAGLTVSEYIRGLVLAAPAKLPDTG